MNENLLRKWGDTHTEYNDLVVAVKERKQDVKLGGTRRHIKLEY